MRRVIAILLAFVGLLLFCSCEKQEAEPDEIKAAYAKLHDMDIDDVSYTCYGEFNKTYVLLFDGVYDDALYDETVDDVAFHFPQIHPFDVYREGAFCTLQEAFDRGFLTHENLLTVREKHRADNEALYAAHEKGTEAIDKEIKAAYIAKFPIHNLTEEDISLRHYGEFDGTYVLLIDVAGSGVAQVEMQETVDGITFHFPQIHPFDVYREGEFCTLQEAFDRGFLTHENLLTVREKHRADNEALYAAHEKGTEAIDKEIKAAYIAKFPIHNLTEEDISLRHYGEFDGTYVLLIDVAGSGVAQVETQETVDGITFCFAVRESFDVYREGEFYGLQEAFELSLLSHENLYTVWQKHWEENPSLYRSGLVTLSEAIKTEIIAAYIATYSSDRFPLTEEDIIGLRCYGAFNGVYVLFVDERGADYDAAIHTEVVADVEFIYSSGHRLTVYSEGEFCSITKAFEKGLLTRDDVQTAQKNYRIGREFLYC